MKEMQAVQPELKKIQERFKDDPQRMNKEMMEFYKKHKINPFGGCLPILIQMPILFGIWQTIQSHIDRFKGESFLWIGGRLHDMYPSIFAQSLATPDMALILLYGLSMYLSQKLTVVDPATAKQQAMMNTFMPIFFTYMMWTWKLPCALILYWLIFNILSIVQQAIIMKAPSPALSFEPTVEKKE
jgi:YidC/Oxa1 family membrane protein insertase